MDEKFIGEKSKLEEISRRLELKQENLHLFKNLFKNCLESIEYIFETEEELLDNPGFQKDIDNYKEAKDNLLDDTEKYFSSTNKLIINKLLSNSRKIKDYENKD